MGRLEQWLDALERVGYTFLIAPFLIALAFGPGPIEAAPIERGMTCTYTAPAKPSSESPSRTYEVEVVSIFEPSYVRDGQPWLWVKRPSEARYQSVIVPPATLSGCRS